MAFLRAGIAADATPILEGNGLYLRPPVLGDYAEWAELRSMSRRHLEPWEPAWPRDDLTRSAYRRRVRHYQREARDDQGYAFSVFDKETGRLIGGLTFSSVRRGVTQSAAVGYWLGLPYVGRGLMTEAVRVGVWHAIGALQLHRLEAAVQPSNTPSIRVLEKNKFTREGYARSYLKIAGHWQDHLLYGLVDRDAGLGEVAE